MKLFCSLTNFVQKNFINIFFIFVVSCRHEDISQNKTFNEKYGEEVEKFKLLRVEPENKKQLNVKLNFNASLEQNEAHYTNGNVAVPEYYSTKQFANQSLAPSQFRFPVEMFENVYAPTIVSPFRIIGDEFDKIYLPSEDAYGIKAGMSEKDYLLVSRKLLQENIDRINSEKTKQDIENSETLIAEQKKLRRRQKMVKIFHQEYLDVESQAKSGAKKNKTNQSKNSQSESKNTKTEDQKNKTSDKPQLNQNSKNLLNQKPDLTKIPNPILQNQNLPIVKNPAVDNSIQVPDISAPRAVSAPNIEPQIPDISAPKIN